VPERGASPERALEGDRPLQKNGWKGCPGGVEPAFTQKREIRTIWVREQIIHEGGGAWVWNDQLPVKAMLYMGKGWRVA